MEIQEFLAKLEKVKYIGSGRHMALCPCHEDNNPSLSITVASDGKILLKCFAGCTTEDIVKAIGIDLKDLFPEKGRGGSKHTSKKRLQPCNRKPKQSKSKDESGCNPPCNRSATVQPQEGLTLEQYSKAKNLPIDFLKRLGILQIWLNKVPALRIPYYGKTGEEIAIRIRLSIDGDNRFKWAKKSKPQLYGLNRKFKQDHIILCEGESDCHTLWLHGFNALGIPGASNWNEKRNAIQFDGIQIIYVIVEPDSGGESVIKWLSNSSIRDRVKLIQFKDSKDPSELYLTDPNNFKAAIEKAIEDAIDFSKIEEIAANKEKDESFRLCRHIAESPNVLDMVVEDAVRLGLAGEERVIKIIYLAIVSRYLERPISIVVKGPSSGGKSILIEIILKFFPKHAFYYLTSMSDRVLAYSNEPLKNRMLVVIEAGGISGETGNYLIRSLLSEGQIRHETVMKTPEGLQPVLIEKDGPTGLILTTTKAALHPENETRMLSINVTDSKEQTAKVLLALAEGKIEVDLKPWHALQTWLDHSVHKVVIPYSKELAILVPPIAVRLRRDFMTILNLIKAHAILHQRQRKISDGSIIADLQDYAAVRDLVSEIISDGIGASVSLAVKETVEAVEGVISKGNPYATATGIATVLKLDKSAASRRVRVAINKGYLINNEKQRGKPLQLVVGDPLPEEVEILPSPETLSGCTVASDSGDITHPTPPSFNDLKEVVI